MRRAKTYQGNLLPCQPMNSSTLVEDKIANIYLYRPMRMGMSLTWFGHRLTLVASCYYKWCGTSLNAYVGLRCEVQEKLECDGLILTSISSLLPEKDNWYSLGFVWNRFPSFVSRFSRGLHLPWLLEFGLWRVDWVVYMGCLGLNQWVVFRESLDEGQD